MIPLEWKDRAGAARNRILVEPDRPMMIRHGIIVPDTFLANVRQCIGIVRDISCSLDMDPAVWFSVGDRVMFSPIAGQCILFGYLASEETEIWSLPPQAVKAKFLDKSDKSEGETVREDPLRFIHSFDAQMPTVDERWAEGDPEGKR